jgi:hypothetical protein
MKPGKRFGLSAMEKSDIWRRWKAGETLHEIGRAFDKPHTSIRCLLLTRGGIPPAIRRRSRPALTRSEREDVSRGIASRSSIRDIAKGLQRAAFEVSRNWVRAKTDSTLKQAHPVVTRAAEKNNGTGSSA